MALSGHRGGHCLCPLLTQSGQRASLATVEPRQQLKLSVGVTSIPRRSSLYPPKMREG